MTEPILKKIGHLPKKDKFDLHHWADYIELKCLINIDGVISIDDFIDDYRQRHKDLKEGDVDSSDEDSKNPEFQNETFASNCFKIIEYRAASFKEYYPFVVDKKTHRAITLKKKINLNHKKYLFLLFSSTLSYTNEYQSELTKSFELFSLQILKGLLPKKAEVHLFGSGNKITGRRYAGGIWDKIVKLSSDLNEGKPKAKKEDFPATATGDKGLDIIAYIKHGDNQPHLITYSGQAACTDEWDVKQFSSSYEAWKNRISFSVRPMNFVFAPFSLRNANGEWHRRGDIGDCVLLDRSRLLHHFKNDDKYFKKLPSYKVITKLLTIKESPVN